MWSSCESSPQLQVLMCHHASVGSLHSPPGAGAELDPGRSCLDAELLSSEEKQERQVQRQV